ncbi:MAG: L-2-amino-thiazoline-4-carboxylic acid hydrolase [Thermoanaerobaculia bacterium]|nr:L-2-amino-thiazoline-4-carboxylic acid hydrolase [Thermoanaerobaculia bacterium]
MPADATEMTPKRRAQLLRAWKGPARLFRKALGRRLGAADADAIGAEASRLYASLIDDIPLKLTFLAGARDATYVYLAHYKVLAARGMSAPEIGELFGEAWDANPARKLPSWLPRLLVRPLLPLIRRKLKKDAELSQERRDPADFVYTYVEPDGDTDFGIDVTDCAICRCFRRHDAEEIIPWLCALDDRMSDALGLGLRRSGTRALGHERCDFRYKLGGEPRPVEIRPLPVVETAERP